MNNYYECGDGWLPLIKEAENIVEQYNKKHKNTEPLEFLQIKEKFQKACLFQAQTERFLVLNSAHKISQF